MKRLVLFLLAFCILVLTTGCGENKNIPVSSKPANHPSPPAQMLSPELPPITFANRGNSCGNSINGGFIANYRERLFFADSSVGYRLASLGKDSLRILTDCPVSNISAYENWIYFCNEADSKHIYRCRTDGGEFSMVTGIGAAYFQIVGNWIYFSNLNDDGKLYRVSADGQQLEKLSDDIAADINAYPETVYYRNLSDNSSLYYLNIEERTKGRIVKNASTQTLSQGVYLFYISLEDGLIYRSSFDGIYITCLNKNAVSMNIVGQNLFFCDRAAIYRMDFNGANAVKLADANTKSISVIGSVIYYIDNESGNLFAVYENGGKIINESLSGKYYSAVSTQDINEEVNL